MRVEHIPAIGAIERLSFTQPWPAHAYRKEIQQNRMAHYFVVKRVDAPAFEPGELSLNQTAAVSEPNLVGRVARLFRPPSEPPEPGSEEELRRVVAYAGLWLMSDEAHITTIAV